MEGKAGPILMGVAYLALVVFIILFCAGRTSTFDDYSKYWGLFATLVGVATGAIPSYFFKTQADKADNNAAKESDRAEKASKTAMLFAGVAPPDAIEKIRSENSTLFE